MKAQYQRSTGEQAATISGLTRKSIMLVKGRHRGRGSGFLAVLPGTVFLVVLLAIF